MQAIACYLVPERLVIAELGRSLKALCVECGFDGRRFLVNWLSGLVRAIIVLLASTAPLTVHTALAALA